MPGNQAAEKSAGLALLLRWIAGFVFFACSIIPAGFGNETQRAYLIGEKLISRIEYLGIPVGRAEASVKEIIEFEGRKAYHIEVRVSSFRAIDLFYKVRDEHHSYVDVETLASLGYEKKIHEGRRRVQEKVVFDYRDKKARYLSSEGEVLKEVDLPGPVQDALSCGYFFRTMPLAPAKSVFIPVHADGKNWSMEVRLHEIRKMEIKNLGSFEALRTEPIMEFQGIFIRRGRIEGWISLDKRRIPLRMKVQIPVLGAVIADLAECEPEVIKPETKI